MNPMQAAAFLPLVLFIRAEDFEKYFRKLLAYTLLECDVMVCSAVLPQSRIRSMRTSIRMKLIRQKGSALVYGTVCMMVIVGITSLAIDVGRVQCAKTELQNAVDAAARYASTGLSDTTSIAKAQSSGGENAVDGTALAIQSGDVETGIWTAATKTFTVTASNPNAVRVTGRRTSARGNPVHLYFASLFGRSTYDLTTQSIALMTPGAPTYKFVALNGVNLGGTVVIDSNTGETATASVASNGGWNMNTGSILGDVFYRGSAPTGGTISGTKTLMPSNISYTAPTTPTGVTALGNVTATGKWSLGAGNYSCTDMNITGAYVSITGDINLYCSGNLTIDSTSTINSNNGAYKINIYMTSGSGFNYNSTNTMYASVYAPSSPANLNAGTFIGTMVCGQLSMSGNAKMRYDSRFPLPANYPASGGSTGTASIATVR